MEPVRRAAGSSAKKGRCGQGPDRPSASDGTRARRSARCIIRRRARDYARAPDDPGCLIEPAGVPSRARRGPLGGRARRSSARPSHSKQSTQNRSSERLRYRRWWRCVPPCPKVDQGTTAGQARATSSIPSGPSHSAHSTIAPGRRQSQRSGWPWCGPASATCSAGPSPACCVAIGERATILTAGLSTFARGVRPTSDASDGRTTGGRSGSTGPRSA
jgi:hypothetical protein